MHFVIGSGGNFTGTFRDFAAQVDYRLFCRLHAPADFIPRLRQFFTAEMGGLFQQ